MIYYKQHLINKDFGFSYGVEYKLEGGDDIHALLGEAVLRCKDVIGDYLDEEITRKNKTMMLLKCQRT